MGNGIPLHPEGFLNPTMARCIICDELKPFLALLGDKYDGIAPFSMVVDAEPCSDCWHLYGFDKGNASMVVEANDVNGKPRPTGRVCVALREDMKRLYDIDLEMILLLPDDYSRLLEVAVKEELPTKKDTEKKGK